MKILTLKRISLHNLYGTFGIVFVESDPPFAVTLERQWMNNEKGKSCIPTGEYTCKRTFSPKFGSTFEVTGVTGRSAILFHKGNIEDDSHGCILVGESFDPVIKDGKLIPYGITASGAGYRQFMDVFKSESEFKLVVKEA